MKSWFDKNTEIKNNFIIDKALHEIADYFGSIGIIAPDTPDEEYKKEEEKND